MKQKIFFLLPLLSVFFIQNASAFCNSSSTHVYITTNPGNVKYITTLSRRDFMSRSGQDVSPNTLGLTVARLSVSGSYTAAQEEEGNLLCASLESINLRMGYEDLTVYIDKKYSPTSCEYKVIKEHEKYHVAVAQQAAIFFKPDIEKKIQESLKKIKPQIVRTESEKKRVVKAQFDQVVSDLRPLIDHINRVVVQKNKQIDTPESYAATRKLCKNW